MKNGKERLGLLEDRKRTRCLQMLLSVAGFSSELRNQQKMLNEV